MKPPRLGPRGEGWVLGQAVLLLAIGAAGISQARGRASWDDAAVLAAVLGGMAIAAGIVVAVRGILDLGPSLTPMPRPTEGGTLVEHGVYRLVRHPIYSGLVLASLGWSLATQSVVAAALSVALLAWFDLKARREELWLSERYPEYEDYRRRTRKFVPLVY